MIVEQILIAIVTALWFIRSLKSFFSWLYIIQIKEYKLIRLSDYFTTDKGKASIVNPLNGIKLLVLIALILSAINKISILIWPSAIIIGLIYFVESAIFLLRIFKKSFNFPRITHKAALITLIGYSLIAVLAHSAISYKFNFIWLLILLGGDLLIILIALASTFIIFPFSELIKKRVMKKAEKERWSLNKMLTIGVAGSYGKTSTKEFIAELLSSKFKVDRTKENQNTEMAISNFILKGLNKNSEIFIAEMGAYVKGEIKLIANIVKPKIAVITGANEQHLALFGDMDNLLSAEGGKELVDSLPKNGLAIFNGNNIYAENLYKETNLSKIITYSYFNPTSTVEFEPDVWAKNIKMDKTSISFDVFSKKYRDGKNFRLNLTGSFFIENVLLSIATAESLGVGMDKIYEAAKNIDDKMTGIKHIKNADGVNIIKSTYSSNPDAVKRHLEYLKEAWRGSKKVFVMQPIIELGDASPKIHREIGMAIGRTCDLAIVTGRDNLKNIQEGAGIAHKDKIIYSEKPEEIAEILDKNVSIGDVVFLEGRIRENIINAIQ